MSWLGFFRVDSDRKVIEFGPLDTMLVALMKAGAAIRHDCGGRALCGTCRVRVALPGATLGAPGAVPEASVRDSAGGAESAPLRGLSPMAERERERLAALGEKLDGSVRLACQLRSVRDLELEPILPMKGDQVDG